MNFTEVADSIEKLASEDIFLAIKKLYSYDKDTLMNLFHWSEVHKPELAELIEDITKGKMKLLSIFCSNDSINKEYHVIYASTSKDKYVFTLYDIESPHIIESIKLPLKDFNKDSLISECLSNSNMLKDFKGTITCKYFDETIHIFN